MYNAFFNLRENPFALNPNPKFFFWDKVHSDAMKYLMFGIKNKEGFIEILGEAGTGKTLLCLMLLKQLDENTHSVLFLNPPMDEAEFLQTVISRLNLAPQVGNRKNMIEAISEFATQESSQGRNIVFILDEAQHLSTDVLEKIRLLTNSPQIIRPIQVILIGQPELDEKLRAHDLRQLYQRITIRFRLKPLSRKEMEEYIEFRLKQARSSQTITFSRGAVRMVYGFSKGNPRLVNIICDKALMAASLDQTSRISTSLIKAAMKSALAATRTFSSLRHTMLYPKTALAALVLVLALSGGFLWKFRGRAKSFTGRMHSLVSSMVSVQTEVPGKKERPLSYATSTIPRKPLEIPEGKVADEIAKKIVESEVAGKVAVKMVIEAEVGTAEEIKAEIPDETEVKESVFDEEGIMRVDKNKGNYNLAAMITLLGQWGVRDIDESQIDWWGEIERRKFSFHDIALQYGLEASLLKTSLDELHLFNIPVILLEVYDTSLGRSCSMVLTGIDEEKAVVLHPGQGRKIYNRNELRKSWGKKAVVLWRNPDKLPARLISPLMGEKVLEKVWLRLKASGCATGTLSDNHGEAWRSIIKAVRTFQKKNGLRADGIIGVRTRLKLYSGDVGSVSPVLLVTSHDL